ncbi:MAG: hypothetical protein IE916_00160 [Epsilonproteobacteria bacterium]|nr:hypothetical protein [Campylobacterota bacterium]
MEEFGVSIFWIALSAIMYFWINITASSKPQDKVRMSDAGMTMANYAKMIKRADVDTVFIGELKKIKKEEEEEEC